MRMRAVRLNSAMIERICFDDEARTLEVRFRGGDSYTYFEVPAGIYEGLKAAGSAGRYFNERVKGRFRCVPSRRKFRPQAA